MVEHVDVELSLVLIDSHVGSVHSDDVSESVHDGQVLKLVGVDHHVGIGTLGVQGGVNDLEGADESLTVHFVWESSVNDHSIEVTWLGRSEGGLGELDVLVLQDRGLGGRVDHLPWCSAWLGIWTCWEFLFLLILALVCLFKIDCYIKILNNREGNQFYIIKPAKQPIRSQYLP